MISFSLVLLALGAFAKVASSYGAVNRRVADKDKLLDACLVGMQALAGDLKCATSIASPVSGMSPTLTFKRVASAAVLLPATPDPKTEADPFDPFPANSVEVNYNLDGEALVRTVVPPSIGSEVVRGLNGFVAERVGPREMKVALSILDMHTVRTVRRTVYLTSLE